MSSLGPDVYVLVFALAAVVAWALTALLPLRALARPTTAARVLEHIEHYVRFDREAGERAARERFDRRVEEIRLQLSASAAALGRNA